MLYNRVYSVPMLFTMIFFGYITVWGWGFFRGWVEKPSLWAIVFKYFPQFKEKQWPNTFVIFAPRLWRWLYNCLITPMRYAPGRHMWQSQGPWPDSKCSKTVEVGCLCYGFKVQTLSEQDRHWRNPKRLQQYSARVSLSDTIIYMS